MNRQLRIPLDPLNPGQFYACCGLLELFTLLRKKPLGHFELPPHAPRLGCFVVEAETALDVNEVLRVIKGANYAVREGTEKSILPIEVYSPAWPGRFDLDWWLNEFHTKATSLKCWAGQVTSGGLFQELPRLLPDEVQVQDLFREACETSSRLGVDPRSSWNALDFGSSPNTQGREAATFAAVEVLAAFGLQGFRPIVTSRDDVRYNAWTIPLPCSVARLVAAGEVDGIASSAFSFRIAKRGQSYKYYTFAQPAQAVQERTEVA